MVAVIQQRLGKQAQLPVLVLAAALIAALLYLQAPEKATSLDTPVDGWHHLWSYLFWLCHSLSGLLLMSGITRLLSARAHGWGDSWVDGTVRLWVQLLGASVIGALCFAPFAGLLEYLFAAVGVGSADAQSVGELLSPQVIASEFVALLPGFVLSWLLLNLSYQSLQGAEFAASSAQTAPPEVEPEVSAQPKGLLSLLPSALGTQLLVISSDLNYVHVTTTEGTTMVLYSLSRAAEELSDLGLQVHRSHWVSRAAVAAVRRTRKGLQIELPDGSLIPVSRRKEAIVRAEFGVDFRRPGAPSR